MRVRDHEPAPNLRAVADFEVSLRPADEGMPAIFLEIPGGTRAPRQARRTVLTKLAGHVNAATASDAGLIISELVTNSVLHAHVGPDQSLTVDLQLTTDGLRITVTNPGADHQPSLRAFDPTNPGGFGLRLLEQLCSAWGVVPDAVSTTGVWCDLPLNPQQQTRFRSERFSRTPMY